MIRVIRAYLLLLFLYVKVGFSVDALFQATPATNALSHEDLKALTKRTQDGGTEVVEAKAGKGSATLSMA